MCMGSPKPMKVSALPTEPSELEKFRQKRQAEFVRTAGKSGRGQTVATSPMGDTQFGTSVRKPSASGPTVLGASSGVAQA
jgi:hypothetical protein